MLQKFNYQLFRQISPKHNFDYFICLIADSILIISFEKFYIQICEYLHGKFSQIKYLTFTTTITQLTQPPTHPRKDARAGVHNYPCTSRFKWNIFRSFYFLPKKNKWNLPQRGRRIISHPCSQTEEQMKLVLITFTRYKLKYILNLIVYILPDSHRHCWTLSK